MPAKIPAGVMVPTFVISTRGEILVFVGCPKIPPIVEMTEFLGCRVLIVMAMSLFGIFNFLLSRRHYPFVISTQGEILLVKAHCQQLFGY